MQQGASIKTSYNFVSFFFHFFVLLFFFVFVLSPSSIFFLRKRLGHFCVVLFFHLNFLFSLAGYYLLVVVFVFYVIHRLFVLFPSSNFLLGKKTRLFQLFLLRFSFSLAGCHLLVIVFFFYVIHRLWIVFLLSSFCWFSLQFFLADFLAGFLHFYFFVCSVHLRYQRIFT